MTDKDNKLTPKDKPFAFHHIPCPDCQSQEPAEKPEGVVFDNKSTIKTASS